MQLVVRAFPILPEKLERTREIAKEIATHRAREAAEFYRQFTVAQETWHLQETPQGWWVIAVTQLGEKPVEEAAEEYAELATGFGRWLKDRAAEITGIDLDVAPLGPPTECILDSSTFYRG